MKKATPKDFDIHVVVTDFIAHFVSINVTIRQIVFFS